MTQTAEQSETSANERVHTARSAMARIARGNIPTYGLVIACASALAGTVLIWASTRTGSFASGLALLRGDSIYASANDPIVIDTNSETGSVTVDFNNLSDQAVRIVGYNNPCSCFKVAGLPLEVPPHETKTSVIKIKGSRLQDDKVPVNFLTDCPSQQSISLDLSLRHPELSDKKK